MSFLLDTDICSAFLRGNGRVFNRFIQHSGGLQISSVTLAELVTWVSRGRTNARFKAVLEEMLQDVIVLSLDEPVARTLGIVRAGMMDAGTPAPTSDLLIAATALHHDLTMVTHNGPDYANVPGLRVVDWLAP